MKGNAEADEATTAVLRGRARVHASQASQVGGWPEGGIKAFAVLTHASEEAPMVRTRNSATAVLHPGHAALTAPSEWAGSVQNRQSGWLMAATWGDVMACYQRVPCASLHQ